MTITVVLNGVTYTDDSDPTTGMGNGGHRARFVESLSNFLVEAGFVATDAATASAAATTATTKAGEASTSATNAAASASSASTSASTATTQASNASTSATNAASSASSASTSASTATTQASNASSSASAAATSASNAATSATNASNSASTASTAATTATTQATNASNSATAAAASAVLAEDAADLFVAGQLRTVSNSLTAAGTTQTDALALTTEENICTTVASGTGVKLMAKPSTGGKIVYVMNLGANPLKVYPASGESFNALATNASITLAVGGILEARSDTTTRWNVRTNQITDLISNGTLSLSNQSITGVKNLVMNTPETITTTTGAVTLDFSLGSLKLQNELTGAVTYTFTAPPQYSRIQIFFASDGTSSAYGITWPASVKWLGAAFTTTTANKAAMVNGWYDGTNYWMMGSSEV